MQLVMHNNLTQNHDELSHKEISSMWQNMSSDINDAINKHHINNDFLLSTIDMLASRSTELSKHISIATNMLLDVSVITGLSNDSVPIFSKDAIIESSENIYIDKNTFAFSIKQDIRDTAIISDIAVSGNGNSQVASGLIKRSTPTKMLTSDFYEYESVSDPLSMTANISFADNTVVNGIEFNIRNTGVGTASIESIWGYSSNGMPIDLLGNASNPVNMAKYSDGNNVFIPLKLSQVTMIQIVFTQDQQLIEGGNSRYSIGISNLKVGFYEARQNGQIVFGPFKFSSEILKVSYSGEYNEKIAVSASFDNDTWYELGNTKDLGSTNKILNINNISANSISTGKKEFGIYIRFDIESSNASLLLENMDKFDTQIFDYSDTVKNYDVGDNKSIFTAYATDKVLSYGKTDVTEYVSNNMSEYISIDGLAKCVNTDYTGNITVWHPPRQPSSSMYGDKLIISDKKTIMPGSTLYKFTKASKNIHITKNANFGQDHFAVLPLMQGMHAGTYEVTIDGNPKHIDISNGFLMCSSACVFLANSESSTCYVTKPDGEITELGIKNFGDLYYFDIYGTIIQKPSSESYNDKYPIKQNSSSDFSILFGKLNIGQNTSTTTNIDFIILKKVQYGIDKDSNGTFIYTSDFKKAKRTMNLRKFNFAKSVKLEHNNIINGSLKFDASNASSNTFLREVEFINGNDEFVSSNRISISNNRSKNHINVPLSIIEDDNIQFFGSNLFRNRVYSTDELTDAGDWMLYVDGVEAKIMLPPGIYTSDIIDTIVSFNARNMSGNETGMYSVDYAGGMIFTNSPIDGLINAEYAYSNMLLSGISGTELSQDQYTINGDLTINGVIDAKYIAACYNYDNKKEQYLVSPTISDATINIIKAELI